MFIDLFKGFKPDTELLLLLLLFLIIIIINWYTLRVIYSPFLLKILDIFDNSFPALGSCFMISHV